VIIEHDMRVIADVCDRVTVFNQGQVLVEGDFESVTSDERVRDAYLGGAAEHDASLETLIRGEADAPVSEGVAHPPTPRRNRRRPPAVAGGAGRRRGQAAGSAATGVRRALRPRSPGSARSPTGSRGSSARDLISGYGNHRVVDGISMESRDGVTCIFGPNGSGKSTLLKTLAGVVPAWETGVTHRGTDVTQQAGRERPPRRHDAPAGRRDFRRPHRP